MIPKLKKNVLKKILEHRLKNLILNQATGNCKVFAINHVNKLHLQTMKNQLQMVFQPVVQTLFNKWWEWRCFILDNTVPIPVIVIQLIDLHTFCVGCLQVCVTIFISSCAMERVFALGKILSLSLVLNCRPQQEEMYLTFQQEEAYTLLPQQEEE